MIVWMIFVKWMSGYGCVCFVFFCGVPPTPVVRLMPERVYLSQGVVSVGGVWVECFREVFPFIGLLEL